MTTRAKSAARAGLCGALLGMAVAFQVNAATSRDFPEIPAEKRVPLVVVGVVEGVRELAQFPDCFQSDPKTGLETICLDPPPFELRIRVVEQVYGRAVPHRVVVAATTSHFGSSIYTDHRDKLRLFYLVTDGASYILPRYASEVIEQDPSGTFVVPIWGEPGVYWLPCGIRSLEKYVHLDRSSSKLSDYVNLDFVKEHPDWYGVQGKRVMPKRGMYVDDLRRYLDHVAPRASEMSCETE